jgi:hypothetical protein
MVPILGSFSRGVKEDGTHIRRLGLNMNATQSGTDVNRQVMSMETELLDAESKAA